MLTDNTARLHSVLVDLHQVVGQVAQLWLHALWKKHPLPPATEKKHSIALIRVIDCFADYFLDSSIHHLVYKTSEQSEKCLSQFLKAKGDVFKCLVISVQNQRYSVYMI